MLTFKQYLYEEDEPRKKAKEVAEIIIRDCSPFLKEIGDNLHKTPLYRGSIKTHYGLTRLSVRKNRIPKDTSKEMHDVLNSALEQLSGIYYRSQAVFATSSKRIAYDYGHLNLLFPIGNFDYAWSPLVDDAYSWFAEGEHSEAVIRGLLKFDRANMSKYYNDVYDFIVSGKAEYKFNKGMKDAAVSDREIMINCDEYYLVPAWGDFNDYALEVLDFLNILR